MTDAVKFEGVKVTLGGREYIAPPLSLGQIKRLTPQINALEKMGSTLSKELLEGAIDIIHAALSRNYPSIKKTTAFDDDGNIVGETGLDELLDLANFQKIVEAIMGVAGFEPSGEVTGEARK